MYCNIGKLYKKVSNIISKKLNKTNKIMKKGTMKPMDGVSNLSNPETREKATQASIESRKAGGKNELAGVKQAVTKGIVESMFDCPSRAAYQNKHLTEANLDYLIKAIYDLPKGKREDKDRWICQFIDSQLKEALSSPNSRAADRLSSALFNQSLFDQMDIYLKRASAEDIDFQIYKIRSTLYDKQQEVYDDTIDNNHLIINSRRSGKTELMGRLLARDLIRTVEIDGRVVQNRCAYINRNSSAAVRQIRDPLLKALEKTNLRIVKGSVENQELYFSNGAMLLILGNNNAADVDKLRGEKFNTIIMDECGHQRNVRHLMREVIGPCLKDYGKDRRLYMVGTPPRIPHTYVEEVYNNWKERGWKLWHWTFQDNPFIPDRASVIPDVCKEQGVSEDSAFIQREYYGRMDVYDDDAKFIKKYTIEEPADIKTRLWDYAWIGVDYGVTDKAAVVSVLADSKSREMFVVDDWSEDGKEVTALCKEIMRQYENLKALNVRRSVQVIADTNNKEISLELHRTYKIPNVALAYKHDKDLALDQLAEWFKTGRIKLSDKAKAVRKDADLMVWERDEETDKIVHKLDDDTYHGNAMFATLYVSRQFDACVLGSSLSRTAKDIIESTRHKPYKGEYEENYDEYEHCENDNEHWQDAY